MIRQKVVTLMSRTEEDGCPRKSRKEWNLQGEVTGVRPRSRWSRSEEHQAYLLMTLLWTTFRTMTLCVQSFRKSVSLAFKAALVSCLVTIFRLSHDALQRLSSWARFSASTSKST